MSAAVGKTAVDTVVWDFGAVLFRWRPRVLLAASLPSRVKDDISAAHWHEQFFQSFGGDWAEFDRGTVEVDDLAGRIARRTGLTEAEALAVIEAVPHELQPLVDTVGLVHALHERGVRQFYLSNMPAPYADHLEREYAFVRDFEDGLFSGRVQLIKPDAAIFALAEQRFGLVPERTVFIDDHPKNVEAARARGWQAVLATQHAAIHQGLDELGLLG
ncbi:HAD family phosphatase [Aquincola tertiaricarbonis]|uniref:HAD family phosphatase n=1 Tax=Aquincola tertiaricarbonis TaxID=391953 RepID=A0ABY4SDW0_AQUTE|nr:HAD family phosphatase [Aquincola tertiaricarbonis]URI10674.1 HAD family phosphatase [Aquincola tertiaricarbonis]